MKSDDVFRGQLAGWFARMRELADESRPHARVEARETTGGVSLALWPHTSGACSIEVVIAGNQRCDIAVGAETYADQPADLEALEVLIRAAIAGGIVQNYLRASSTGLLIGSSTEAGSRDGKLWRAGRGQWIGAAGLPDDVIVERRAYLPYSR